ncbi:hypothetical protein [Nocardia higoensis]|uniref:hypothetical protein n=1 Tax=Nocardia higoensis TaxID=228599 RepID=UPI0005948191|nr:hypothetical protein [Nocardia higoensis]
MKPIRTRWVIPVTSILATGAARTGGTAGPVPAAIALMDTEAGPVGARVADSPRRDGGAADAQ